MESTGDTSSCSTAANTTDCLLDRLINIVSEKFAADDGKTDWNPITFAFTVPVGIFGILATFLALVTIIQGIFAASPGRRKSSRQVIGKWAERTVTRVSLRELRTYTQATTPRLISKRFLFMLEMKERAANGTNDTTTAVDQVEDGAYTAEGDDDDGNNPHYVGRTLANWHENFQSLARRLPLYSNKILSLSAFAKVLQTSSIPSAAAGWLQLLYEFQLADLPLDNNDTAITAADYLPDDLKAVPAYADIRTIVVLAAVGGVGSFEPEIGSSYPLLIAHTFEIEFRQHPALGRVAAFSGSGPLISPERVQFVEAFKHSDGFMQVQEHLARGLGCFGNWFSIMVPDFYVLDEDGVALHGRDTRKEKCDESWICRELSRTESWAGKDLRILWLLIAKTPSVEPAIFPSHQFPSHIDLVLLCLQSRFWASDKSLQYVDRFASFMSKVPKDYLAENNDGEDITPLQLFLTSFTQDPALSSIFAICVDFIHGDGKVPLVKRWQRQLILHLLEMLDIVLDAMRKLSIPRSGCLSTTLYVTTSMLLAFQKGANNESMKPSPEGLSDWDMGNAQAPVTSLTRNNLSLLTSLDLFLGKDYRDGYHDLMIRKAGLLGFGHWERLRKLVDQCKNMYQDVNDYQAYTLTAEEMVAELLILRAILIAMLFRSAPDISTIARSPIWEHVVPVL